MWSPTSSTLIYGDGDAVLVDALLTVEEGQHLADWVSASGKNLTTIYVTHGHGDHFFGASPGSAIPVSVSVTEVLVMTDAPAGMRASTASRAASRLSATSTLNPCSSSATTVAWSPCSPGSVVKRSDAEAVLTAVP